MRILIPECGGPAGVSALRAIEKMDDRSSFSVEGYDVDPICATSTWVDTFSVSPYAKEEKFRDFVRDKVKNSDLVIPSGGNDLIELSEIKNEFPNALRFISSLDTIEKCVDKIKTFETMKNLPFIPRTEVFRFSDVVFSKPRSGKGSIGCQLIGQDDPTPSDENLLYQEFLPGREITVDALFDSRGKLRVCIPRERTKTRGGISTCARFLNSDIFRKLILQISDVMNFSGPICFQFKEDKNGNPKLMEINPRMAGGYGMSLAIGANFIEMMIKDEYKTENEIIDLRREIIVARVFQEVIVAQ